MRNDDKVMIHHEVPTETDVVLDCEVSDPTDVQTVWYQAGKQLSSWKGIGRHTLRIGTEDCGTLIINCTATNRYGSITRTHFIHVAGET